MSIWARFCAMQLYDYNFALFSHMQEEYFRLSLPNTTVSSGYTDRFVICYMLFSSLPIGAFQWPITSSVTLTFNLNQLFLQQLRFTSLAVFILTHPVNFPVGGNRSARIGENPRLSAEC